MLLLKALLCSSLLAQPPQPDLEPILEPMRRNRLDNILRFWYPRGVDQENGGYRMHFDPAGSPKSGTKWTPPG